MEKQSHLNGSFKKSHLIAWRPNLLKANVWAEALGNKILRITPLNLPSPERSALHQQNRSHTQEQAVLSMLGKMGQKTHTLAPGQSLPVWGSQKALLEGD